MRRALTAALLAALASAAVFSTAGFAGSNSKSGKKTSTARKQSNSAATPPPTMKEALAAKEKLRAAHEAKLAKSLGVSTEKLTAAFDAVKKKNLDQAVTDKQLTAAQRDAILACEKAPLTCDRSDLPAYGHGHRGGFGGPKGARGDMVKDLAAELGVSEDKVTAALKANRPKMGDRKDGRRGHGGRGHGGPGAGFGPPPGMDGAEGPAEEAAPVGAA